MTQDPRQQEITELEVSTFRQLRDLIQTETGIHLSDSKRILLANRLRKRLKALGIETYEQYLELLVSRRGREEMLHFVDAISTNETYFYRGADQLEALRLKILPGLLRTRKTVRIWSAASSTGEEPYSILIAAEEAARAANWMGRIEIIATDINGTVLETARKGLYGPRALRGLPQEYLERYFDPRDKDRVEVKAEMKRKVVFRRHNLLKDDPPAVRLELIFCRNVLMYFKRETQAEIINKRLGPALSPDGYLFIGSSESFVGITGPFRYAGIDNCPIYRLEGRGGPA